MQFVGTIDSSPCYWFCFRLYDERTAYYRLDLGMLPQLIDVSSYALLWFHPLEQYRIIDQLINHP
jgi:hypothetical protein